MMKSYVQDSLNELSRQVVIESALNDLLNVTEIVWEEESIRKTKRNQSLIEKLVVKLLRQIEVLQEEKKQCCIKFDSIREKSFLVRDKFAVDISQTLRDNRLINELKSRIHEQNSKMHDLEIRNKALEDELNKTSPNESIILKAIPQVNDQQTASKRYLFADADNTTILHVFSFLSTPEVLNSAQVNKFFFSRVDSIFGMESSLVSPAWTQRPPCFGGVGESISEHQPLGAHPHSHGEIISSSTLPDSSPAPVAVGLSREMADALSKRLSPVELRAIISLNDRLKSTANQLLLLSSTKEELSQKLKHTESVRDFLVEKLRSAEVAIKSAFSDNNILKKQVSAHEEVISFLDLRGQELEGANSDLAKKIERLQAAYDLQFIKEKALQLELQQYKSRYEELEVSVRTQKKILVKEVKSLRSQLEAMTSECSRFRKQVHTFHQVFLNSQDLTIPLSGNLEIFTETDRRVASSSVPAAVGAIVSPSDLNSLNPFDD